MLMNDSQVQTLVEALPYLSKFKNKTIVVKYGGNAMLNDELKNKVLQDIVFLQCAGMRPVVVHGGGPEITRMLMQAGKKSEFVSGLRVTDAESVGIAEMALVGKINTDLVSRLNTLGGKAVGLNGKDATLIQAKKHLADVYENGEVNLVDIGYVGNVEKVNTELIDVLLDAGFIPVIAPTGVGAQGETYNINADSVAGEVAGALKAEKLLVLTDVRGIYSDYRDENSFISTLTFEKAQELIIRGKIDGGMIPKVRACITALSGGAKKTHIIDGRAEHTILMEILSDKGVGTEVVKELK
ncbi:acetylglutamate kinase [Phascolarctobacterium sp.]|uniref:acetylglutamate kinase n=1 Tax=Phascolarctobacterium sp. TaxID=2049039 RepID=UPI002A7FBDC1|nr:acetylglutamate kinase [Phascolarctobacterium sp.]MDY5044512.1 acetylglutamate kinase [Phascolarctobacterium sp.]